MWKWYVCNAAIIRSGSKNNYDLHTAATKLAWHDPIFRSCSCSKENGPQGWRDYELMQASSEAVIIANRFD